MITLRNLPKAILHVDADAFFASVEQSLKPELLRKPVITGKERGIAASMSYEAKARGVTRGMKLHEVRKVCPECIILPNDYESYSLVSKRLFGILERFTPEVEEYSIDEAFADITGLRRIYRSSYESIARQIQKTIHRELGITVSIGLSLTKSLAKICSKYKKPHGFTCVKGRELHEFLAKIPIDHVCGFGPSSVALLTKNNVFSVKDYIDFPDYRAKKLLGKIGIELWHELRGEMIYPIQVISHSPSTQKEVSTKKNLASISKVKTFTPPSNDKNFVRAQLLRNLESAFIKLRRNFLRTWTLGIYLRDSDFRSSGEGVDLDRPTSSTLQATSIASYLFERVFSKHVRYRQTGVFLNYLEPDLEWQHDLFEDPCKVKRHRSISECMDRVNQSYGKHCLHMGSTTYVDQFRQHLGERGDFANRKTNLLKGETFRQRINIPLWDIKV